MKKIVLLIFLLTMTFAEPLTAGKAYIVSSINVNSNKEIESGQSYSLVPQIVVATGSENYAGSVTPFTGCYGGKRYEKGSETGNCLTGVVNSLNSNSETDALSAYQGKILNDKIRTNFLKPELKKKTISGVTIVYNENDGTYILNGTATDTIHFKISRAKIQNGTYRALMNGANDNIQMQINNYASTDYYCRTSEPTNITVNDGGYTFYVRVLTGTVCNNVVIRPMLTTDLNATKEDFISYNQSLAINQTIDNEINDLSNKMDDTFTTITQYAGSGAWYKIAEYNARDAYFELFNIYLFKRSGIYSVNLGSEASGGASDGRNRILTVFGEDGDMGLKWESSHKVIIYAYLYLAESYTFFNRSWENLNGLTIYDEPIQDNSITSSDLKLSVKI